MMMAQPSEYTVHRNYCNDVKRQILKYATFGFCNVKLLDMCCGRGGDIFKWDTLGIRRVYGLDSDPQSIQEAIRRYKEYRRKTKNPIIVNFHVQSAMSSEYIRDTILRGEKVNIVSCMFALHYFSETTDILRTFLRNVSDNLISGGVFIGVAPDSTYIKKLLDHDDPYKNDNVVARSTQSVDAGGTQSVDAKCRSYYFLIKHAAKPLRLTQSVDYFSFRGESLEYLIEKEEFVCLANEEGLEVVEIKNIFDSACNVDQSGEAASLSTLSQLYFSFIFRKK